MTDAEKRAFAAGIEAAAVSAESMANWRLTEGINVGEDPKIGPCATQRFWLNEAAKAIRALTSSAPEHGECDTFQAKAPVVPRVKPLVWISRPGAGKETISGKYAVRPNDERALKPWCYFIRGAWKDCETEEEGIAACNADHEARILSQIDMAPVTVQEAARVLCDAPELAAWWSDAGWADINVLAEQDDGQ